MHNDQEYDYLSQEIRTYLQSGAISLAACGKSFARAQSSFADEKAFKAWVENEFGSGIYRIVKNLIRLSKLSDSTGTNNICIPFAPQIILQLASSDVPPDVIGAAIEKGTINVQGTEMQIRDAQEKDIVRWLEDKIEELRGQLDEREKKIRDLSDEASELREELMKASKADNQEEVDRLRKEIAEKKTEIVRLKHQSQSGKKLLEKYFFSLKTQARSFFLSEAAAFMKEFQTELPTSIKKDMKDLFKTFVVEIRRFEKDLGLHI
jgi:hypothetical protein